MKNADRSAKIGHPHTSHDHGNPKTFLIFIEHHPKSVANSSNNKNQESNGIKNTA